MTTRLYILVLVAFVVVFSSHCVADTTDFRNATWGISIDSVRNLETARLQKEPGEFAVPVLSYEDTLRGQFCYVRYGFNPDSSLKWGAYIFDDGGRGYSHYLGRERLFTELKQLLTKKYGPPTSVDAKVFNRTVWHTTRTKITLKIIAFGDTREDGPNDVMLTYDAVTKDNDDLKDL